MTIRPFRLAVAGVGLFLAIAAVTAIVARAPLPAVTFAGLALGHLFVATADPVRSRPIAAIAVVLGLAELAALGAGSVFIIGVESAEGFDLGDLWFAPLNGYATVVVTIALAIVAAALVVDGVRALGHRKHPVA
jgi:hypothetical protein